MSSSPDPAASLGAGLSAAVRGGDAECMRQVLSMLEKTETPSVEKKSASTAPRADVSASAVTNGGKAGMCKMSKAGELLPAAPPSSRIRFKPLSEAVIVDGVLIDVDAERAVVRQLKSKENGETPDIETKKTKVKSNSGKASKEKANSEKASKAKRSSEGESEISPVEKKKRKKDSLSPNGESLKVASEGTTPTAAATGKAKEPKRLLRLPATAKVAPMPITPQSVSLESASPMEAPEIGNKSGTARKSAFSSVNRQSSHVPAVQSTDTHTSVNLGHPAQPPPAQYYDVHRQAVMPSSSLPYTLASSLPSFSTASPTLPSLQPHHPSSTVLPYGPGSILIQGPNGPVPVNAETVAMLYQLSQGNFPQATPTTASAVPPAPSLPVPPSGSMLPSAFFGAMPPSALFSPGLALGFPGGAWVSSGSFPHVQQTSSDTQQNNATNDANTADDMATIIVD